MAARRTRSPHPAADLSPEVEWYLKSRGYQLPRWVRPAFRTPEPRDFPDAVFDPERVDRVIVALRMMRHTQGKWRGKPLDPDAWQVAFILAPIFGWVAPDDSGDLVRIVQEAYVEVARKAGKTTLVGGLDLYLAFADGEPGAQVYAVAASKDQARYCFDPAALIARNSPELIAAGVRSLRSRIVRDDDGSYFAVASSVGDLLQGANPHGATIDELHIHKSPDVVDAVESGTGARSQPLIFIITTADDGRTDSVYAMKREYMEALCRGKVKNPRQYAVIFAADAEDQHGGRPFLESTWRKANPGYGVSPTKAFMEREAAKARQSPVNLARFLRLNLGIRTKQETRFIDLPAWDRNAGLVVEEQLLGRLCTGGLDLASVSDLCALGWVFPDDNGGGFDVLWRHWAPETQLPKLNERTAGQAAVWVREGWLTLTPGEVTDYDYIREAINVDRERFEVAEIAYDPWNSSQLVNDLVADEAPMVKMRQGFVSMSAPTKELLRVLLQGTASAPRFRHGGNPIMRWQVDHLAVEVDAAGNFKPSKKKSSDKIDGVVAAVMALDRAINREPEQTSAYEDDGLMVV